MLASGELVLGLLLREQYRYSPAAVQQAIEGGDTGNIPAQELPLVRAAAAISGGEPRRALRELESHSAAGGSDEQAVAEAIRRVALVLDRNWFPGGAGAVLDEGDIETMLGQPLPPGSPQVALLTYIATSVVAMAPTWRSVVESSRQTGQQAPAATILQHAQEVGARLAQYGAPLPLGYFAVINADLFVRAGQGAAAASILGIAETAYQAANDLAGMGSLWLVRGDWAAEPMSQPETLGLNLETTLVSPGPEVTSEPAFARQLYEQAAAAFSAADAQRGSAAVELRMAHLDRLEGDRDTARRRLENTAALAEAAGDGALLQLARIHRALLEIEDGRPSEADSVGVTIAGWVKRDGSYSYARGLARLCLASARRWREAGDFVRGRAALRISDAINSGVGAIQEPALVGVEAAESYGGASYRRALLVLTELELDAAIDRLADKPQAMAWMGLVDRATRAYSAAVALRDSAAIETAAGRLGRLAAMASSAAAPNDSGQSEFVSMASAAVDGSMAQADVLSPLYRATLARATGLPDEATRCFEEALAAAQRAEPEGGLLSAVTLATMGRPETARPIVQRLVSSGQLPPDLATAMLMRVGDPASARVALARLDAMGRPPGRAESISELALRAEVLAANGEWPNAGQVADEGVGRFEERLARLSRDVLRISASDDIDVVSLYTTAIRARLAMGDPTGGDSFRLSDRCRGMALSDLLSDDALAAEPDAAAALRRWLQAGVKLAQVFEGVGQQEPLSAHALKMSIARTERELDEAEADLQRQAPELLADRRRPRPTPELAEIQALLRPETVLLQYHSFDDELFIWAVSKDSARLVRQSARTAVLTSEARQFHRLSADGESDEAQRAELGAGLAGQLLDPLRVELADHGRVVVVPHAGLSLLPFHLLPFGADVLGTTHTVSYLPAAAIAPRWRGHPLPRLGPDALIVGDPLYAAALRLSRLPAARTEAAVIARRLGSAPLLAEAATAEAVGERIAGARVVHLATHGRTIDGAPNSAELALANGDRLTLAELMGMDTTIDLAVLSACDTGRGTTTASGDVIGLARALLAAGARDVVVSLWPVDDQAACLTMSHFYERLDEGSDVSSALAAAQKEVRGRSDAEQANWYRELAAGLPIEVDPPLGGTRQWRAEAAASSATHSGHPTLWAPFIHIGLQ